MILMCGSSGLSQISIILYSNELQNSSLTKVWADSLIGRSHCSMALAGLFEKG